MRSYYRVRRRIYRTWRPLFNFIFQTAITNCYKIAENAGFLKSKQSGHSQFRISLARALMAFNSASKRSRGQDFTIYEDVESPQNSVIGTSPPTAHCGGTLQPISATSKNCKAYLTFKRTASSTKRKALEELSVNSKIGKGSTKRPKIHPHRSRYGCSNCKVNLCQIQIYWENHLRFSPTKIT
jgi:hypothetical protein